MAVPEAANVCWSLDFTSAVLRDGRRFRTLHVLDDYNRELLGVEIDFSLPAARVVQVLMRLVEYHGRPAQLRTGNGPVYQRPVERYNTQRPHQALNFMPPIEFKQAA